MNTLLHFYPGDKFVLLTANVLLQATVVILAAWLVAKLLFRRHAAVRHGLWLAALVLVLVSPLTAFLMDAANVRLVALSLPAFLTADEAAEESADVVKLSNDPRGALNSTLNSPRNPTRFMSEVLTPGSFGEIPNRPPREFASRDASPSAAPSPAPLATATFEYSNAKPATPVPPVRRISLLARLRTIAGVIFALWLVGVVYGMVRLVRGGLALRRLLQLAQPGDKDERLRPILAEIERHLGLKKMPPVLVWRDAKLRITPLTIGIFRPVVMLSKNLLKTLTPEELREVLIHECAHVLRRDSAVGLLQRFAAVLFWPYPLVALMNRQLTIAREEVCDNYVLLHTSGPQYAQTLFDLSERIHPLSPNLAPVGLFQHSCPLEKRVAGLLDMRRNVMTKINRWTALCLAIVFITITLAAAGARILKAEPKAVLAPEETSAKEQTAETAKQKPLKQETLVGGQVVDPKGKTLAGVQVFIVGTKRDPYNSSAWEHETILGSNKTDAQGRFQISVPRIASATYYQVHAIAFVGGYGIGFKPVGLDVDKPEINLQLPQEQILECRLVNAQGQPASEAKVCVTSIGKGESNKDYAGLYFPELTKSQPYWPAPMTTDAEGRFTLRGIASDQQVGVEIRDDRFARDQLDIKPKDKKDGRGPTLTALPAQSLKGNVIYEDTQKPVAHARLSIGASYNPGRCIMNMPAQADENGHFKVNPYSGKMFFITAYPPEGEPYLAFNKKIELQDGKLPPKIEVAVPRGLLVRGKIVEAALKKPVAGAGVQYEEVNNPYAKEGIISGWNATVTSNAEGAFQIVVPPGRGVFFVKGPGNDFIFEQITAGEIEKGTVYGQRHYANAIIPLDLKPDSRPEALNVSLRRGVTVKGKLVGPGDKPVEEAQMVSRIFLGANETEARCFPVVIHNGQFELHGLDQEKSVPVYFLDPKNELGAVMEISGKSADIQPLVVRLEPCGKAAGRFLGAGGKPLVKYRPSLQMVVTPGAPRYSYPRSAVAADEDFVANIDRLHYWDRPLTDAEGRCEFPALIPGATYRLESFGKAKDRAVEDFTVKSGETLQLPEIKLDMKPEDVKPPEQNEDVNRMDKIKEDKPAIKTSEVIQRRTVNKLVKDFPEKTDLSTPEAALAAYHRASARKDAKAVLELGWRKYGEREIEEIERFWKSDPPKDMEVYLQAVLDAELREVLIYRNEVAGVISKLKFPEGVGRHPFSLRYFGKIDGQWKNLGEDRLQSIEAARLKCEENKDSGYKMFLELKNRLAGKQPPETPSNEFKVPPDKYNAVKATTPDSERLILMGLVENFFNHNAVDITARKSLNWGEAKKSDDGSRSIRYKFEARIWDKETMIFDRIFAFDKDNVMTGFKDPNGPPVKKQPKKVDVETKEGMKALVEDFFADNFRDVTSRETIEWGDVEKDKDGNSSIRYKYEATIWSKDVQIMNQIFTFDKKGEFVRVKDVEGYPRKVEKKEKGQPAAPSNKAANANQAEIDKRWRWLFGKREVGYDPANNVPLKYAEARLKVVEAELRVSRQANEKVHGTVPQVRIHELESDVEARKLICEYYRALKEGSEKTVANIAARYAKAQVDKAEAQLKISTETSRRVTGSVPEIEIRRAQLKKDHAEINLQKTEDIIRGDEKKASELSITAAKKDVEYQQKGIETYEEINRRVPGSIPDRTVEQAQLELELAKIDLEALTKESVDDNALQGLLNRRKEIEAKMNALPPLKEKE
jgi:beta-lactamase regulating signal transducer with metallopeptidase domain